MVDRETRDRYLRVLRPYASGLISHQAYWDQIDSLLDSGDPAVTTAYYMMQLYEPEWFRRDFFLSLERHERREVAMLILFLQSDCEYTWQEAGCGTTLLYTLTLGLWGFFDKRNLHGERQVFPFYTLADFDEARRRPRLLTG